MSSHTLSLSFLFALTLTAYSQSSIYDVVPLGNRQVGYADTLLFDQVHNYEAYGYAGAKPQFIQIWHPLQKRIKKPTFLTFGELLVPSYQTLNVVQNQLMRNYEETLIRDCLEENLLTGEENDFGKYSYTDVLKMMGTIPTKSIHHKIIQPSKAPIIIYHHGSRSGAFENFAMAEYFASRGFIFVAASYHLPYENSLFGLKPFHMLVANEDEHSVKSTLKYAQSLSSSSSIFFIGHSWGAQMGLRTFDDDATIKGLISLETTIEFKTDTLQIKDMWPEVYGKVTDERVKYPFPILFCAATGEAKPYTFFEHLRAPSLHFISTKKEFEHNAYTSVFYLRYFISAEVVQPDKEVLEDRLPLYAAHLAAIHAFISSILDATVAPGTEVGFIEAR